MIQQTSLGAWEKVSGHLRTKRESVYHQILKHPGCTDKELAFYLRWPINKVTPRRGELVTRNMVRCLGIRSQDGRVAMSWTVMQT